jgi:hypothetical protein
LRYSDELKKASTIESQLDAMKRISRDANRKAAIDFLVDIYFLLKLKNPIRKGISW